VTTYDEAARSFDHSMLATLPAYARLRQALNDLADEAGEHDVELAVLLDAARDMTATNPLRRRLRALRHLAMASCVERDGGWLTCSYRCPAGTPGPAATPRTITTVL
jgi:hypothetical protein